MLRKTTLVAMLGLISLPVLGQAIRFEPFQGVSYHIPYDNYKLDYGSHVYDYDTLSTFTWQSINVSERETDKAFPDIPKSTGFGIVLRTSFKVNSAACYEFNLTSDDGSLLFIEDSLRINNGGNHKMTEKKDTFLLKTGKYQAKLWYQQLYPTKYGFIFNASYLGDRSLCSKEVTRLRKKIVLTEVFTFESGSYKLQTVEFNNLDSIVNEIKDFNPAKLYIYAHTDDVGGSAANERLSLQRARSLLKYLEKMVDLAEVEVETAGFANRKPLIEGRSAAARSANRRVEIILE